MHLNISDKSRKILITLLAGVLGNLLGFLSTSLISLQPQIAFDLSHFATYAVAIYLGPFYGLLAGAVVALYPYVKFGVLGVMGPVLGLSLILGKAMTGWFAGTLSGRVRPYLVVVIAFIPEFLLTVMLLKSMQCWLQPALVTGAMLSQILYKEWVEILILSFVLETVARREIMETAILLTEIFIVAMLIRHESIQILLMLLSLVFITLIIIDLVKPEKIPDTPTENTK
jgi:hypothetical protein